MIGQAIRPRAYEPTVDTIDEAVIETNLNDIRAVVKKCVDAMPSHQDFITQNCAAPIPASV
jgi:tryptophan halogenase